MASTRKSPASIEPAPAPLAGALWMIGACLGFAAMAGIIRHVSAELHPFEIAFFRNLFGLAFMLPWLARVGWGGLKTRRIGLYTVRGIVGLGAMMAWFWAVTILPLADATALSFTAPLFATILAALVLAEVVRARRWAAIIIGFVGALIILRPGVQEIGWPTAAVLFSSLLMATATVMIKILSRTEPTSAIVTYMVIYLTPLSLIPALFVWQTPSWTALAWLVALGGVATAGHQCLTRSFTVAEASAVMPFDFTRLIFAALIGYFFFDQIPDLWSGIGAGVIVAASVYVAHREAVAARSAHAARDTAAERAGR
ncbi:MAG: DMT family transporter [Alphaproteobacteria bacterium]